MASVAERLKGRGCIVTGAGAGIGLAVARAFASEGANVLVNDIDEDAASKAASSIVSARRPGRLERDPHWDRR